MRNLVLAYEPLCRECKRMGRVTAAEEVDHIVPRSEGGALYDMSNLQPLCRECHARKSSGEQSQANRTPNKGACIHGMPRDRHCPQCEALSATVPLGE